jgi:cytochrome c-type biogenesis protein CcmE
MPVAFKSAAPANFEMAIEVTAIGKFDGRIFRADNLLVKCPTKYQGTEAETKSYPAQ